MQNQVTEPQAGGRDRLAQPGYLTPASLHMLSSPFSWSITCPQAAPQLSKHHQGSWILPKEEDSALWRSLKGLSKNPKVFSNLQHQSRAPFTNNAKEGLLKPFRSEQVLYGTICNKLKNQTKQTQC